MIGCEDHSKWSIPASITNSVMIKKTLLVVVYTFTIDRC